MTHAKKPFSKSPVIPDHMERGILACMLALYAAACFVSLRWYPIFIDEAPYTDPAISLLLGQGFVSGAWPYQTYGEFWAGNVPLYQLCLIPWLKFFGFSQVTVRSLNIALAVAGVGLCWLAIKQLGVLSTSLMRLVAVLLILCSYGAMMWVNGGRPDAVCIPLAGLAAWGFSIQRKLTRYMIVFAAAAAAPWAGLPLAVVIGFAGMLLVAFFGRRYFQEVICLAVGGVVGSAALLAFYGYHGVLPDFLQSLTPHSSLLGSGSQADLKNALKHRVGGLLDYTLLCLIGASIPCWLASLKNRAARPWIITGVISVAGVPALLACTGVFPIYYAWYAFIPGVVANLALWERGWVCGRWLRGMSLMLLIFMVPLGFARVWAIGFYYREDHVSIKMETAVGAALRADDVVIAELGWFAAKAKCAKVYFGNGVTNLTIEEAGAINAVACTPEYFQSVRSCLQGNWVQLPGGITVPRRNTHSSPFSRYYRDNPRVEVRIYRRKIP